MAQHFVVFLLVIAATSVVFEANAATDKVVCYFGSWSVYRPGKGKFDVEDIDPFACTHLMYSFLGIAADGHVKILDHYNDVDQGALLRFNALKQRNPNLKTLIAVGGWSEGSKTFSKVCASSDLRRNFVNSAIAFIKKYGFNGLDLDWEYPNQRGGVSADKANFELLIKEFRSAFTQYGYLLTAAVPATKTSAKLSYNVPGLSNYLDFVNIMTYDFHGSFDGKTGQNAPLYASSQDVSSFDKERNIKASVEYWISAGLSPKKAVLGLAAYGRSFTLSNTANNGLGASSSGEGKPGIYTDEAGILGYNEVCELLKSSSWTDKWNEEQKSPYAYKGNQWVSYDNAKSIQLKVDYAKSKGLGGVMVWSIDTDDFKGTCGEKSILLKTINRALKLTNDGDVVESPISPTTTKRTVATSPASGGFTCSQEGYSRDPTMCSRYYYCLSVSDDDTWKQVEFNCSSGLVFDTTRNSCNYANHVKC